MKFLILDVFNILHRAYHALPQNFTDSQGSPTNAIYGVSSMLISVLDAVKPDYVVAASDGKKPTFRLESFTGYKAHRKPMDDALSSQIPKVFEILDAFGIYLAQVDGYEADDLVATFVRSVPKSLTAEVFIVSNDKDLLQLAGGGVFIMLPSVRKGGKTEWLGRDEVVSRMGFEPELIADYKSLRGDPSDNIPGVFGVGDVGAKKLLAQYGCLENIYAHISDVAPKSLQKKLIESQEQAVMSKNLATLIYDVPLKFDLEEFRYKEFNKLKVRTVLEKYNFVSLIKRLNLESSSKTARTVVSKDQIALF